MGHILKHEGLLRTVMDEALEEHNARGRLRRIYIHQIVGGRRMP